MNNRYFGNIHDFYKYALLRLLVGLLPLGGGQRDLFKSLGVCWMLTADDPSKSEIGHEFLKSAGKWGVKGIDQDLFSKLREWRERGELRAKGVNLLHPSGLLDGTRFFGAPMPIEKVGREKYFEEMRKRFGSEKRDLVFLDPDYGLALGARDWGPGFLRASEVAECYQDGFSVMFYQSQYGSQPDPARLIRGELRRAFGGGILPPVYAIEADEKEAGLVGQHAEAGDISPMFFLLPQPGKREKVRQFLSDFRARMWRREGRGDVFKIPGRIGMFVDYDDDGCTMEKIRFVQRQIREDGGDGMIRWSDKFAGESGIFWNGERFRQQKQSGKKWRGKEPERLEELPVVKTDATKEAVDTEISKRIRACVEHGEVDAVVLLGSDKDYKLDAVITGKHGVPFFQILRGDENKKNFQHGQQLIVVDRDDCGNFHWRKF